MFRVNTSLERDTIAVQVERKKERKGDLTLKELSLLAKILDIYYKVFTKTLQYVAKVNNIHTFLTGHTSCLVHF